MGLQLLSGEEGQDLNILPLLTAIVAAAFTYMLARQYIERKKFHQLLWTFAMLFYAITAFMEFLMNPDILGPSVIAFKVYYILAAPLVGLLGAGVVYLLAGKRKADIFLGFIYSDRFIKAREALISIAREKQGIEYSITRIDAG